MTPYAWIDYRVRWQRQVGRPNGTVGRLDGIVERKKKTTARFRAVAR
jgi:hypothetical protein